MSLAVVWQVHVIKLEVYLIFPTLVYLAYFIKEIQNSSACYVELEKHLEICKYTREVNTSLVYLQIPACFYNST